MESLTELKEKLEEEETEKGKQLFKSREQLMVRANSLKKAVRRIIEQAERGGWSRRPRGGQPEPSGITPYVA